MKISKLLGINASQLQLDFIDINIDFDCPLYVDPFLIAYSNSQWTIETDQVIKNFFNEFKTAILEETDIEHIINNIIFELTTIPTGKDAASQYHHFIKFLLEILWYPYLITPIIEREIHNGRKRIDIVMDNKAKDGFFFKMHQVLKIFCPYIY